MYIRNKILYDNNGDACAIGDRVKIVCDDGKIFTDTITMITDEQEVGFEDNEIYLKNNYVVLYNISEVYKI